MRIAIHNSPNSFSQEWISYCEAANIDFGIVNCYDNDIIDQLKEFDGLMWHFHHMGIKDLNMARSLLHALHHRGYPTFPNFNTMWHFDDKLAQKYLLEALDIDLVPTFVQYSLQDAMKWIDSTTFPKVFKLRGGAGSFNVKLIHSKEKARSIARKMYKSGMENYRSVENIQERYRLFSRGLISFWSLIKGVLRVFKKPMYNQVMGKEIAYTYWQEFIANNDGDIRVIVIGDKAFAIKRMNRKGDFRASGSGTIYYEKKHFSEETIRFAFDVAQALETQCVGFDIVYDKNDNPKIVEISYGFSKAGYRDCVGYWDSELEWHDGEVTPYKWMVDDLISSVQNT